MWLNPTWIEHATFWSGVRRATIAPRILSHWIFFLSVFQRFCVERSFVFFVRFWCEPKKKTTAVNPSWIEHTTFWSGVRRATIAPRIRMSVLFSIITNHTSGLNNIYFVPWKLESPKTYESLIHDLPWKSRRKAWWVSKTHETCLGTWGVMKQSTQPIKN